MEDAGLTALPVPERAGGAGATVLEAATVLRAAGWHAVPIPLAENGLLAGWLLAGSGRTVPAGPLTAAVGGELAIERGDDGWRLAGRLNRVAWAGIADRLILLITGQQPSVLSLPRSAYRVELGRNLADEPRDDVLLDNVDVPPEDIGEAGPELTRDAFWLRGALSRALLMAGAADRILDVSARYTRERQQFGRPISQFQAVQQHLAEMAGAVASIGVAADAAARSFVNGSPHTLLQVATAKETAGRAGSTVARLAHQIHGAMGLTWEYPLRLWTTRLWAWRGEYGNDEYWAQIIGHHALNAGADGLWPLVTSC
jgi:acyl-CoA dehydrogenase